MYEYFYSEFEGGPIRYRFTSELSSSEMEEYCRKNIVQVPQEECDIVKCKRVKRVKIEYNGVAIYPFEIAFPNLTVWDSGSESFYDSVDTIASVWLQVGCLIGQARGKN